MKGDIYEFANDVFPLKLWVAVEPTLEDISMRFNLIEGDSCEIIRPITPDDIKPYWGAYRITVCEKETKAWGCLVVLADAAFYSDELVAHEVSHTYDDFSDILGIPSKGETRAYFTEWLFKQTQKVWRLRNKKGQWQIFS